MTHRIIENLAVLYASGLTLREIAKQFDVSKNSVRKTLLLQGIALRPPNGDQQKKMKGPGSRHVGVSPYGYARLRGKLVVDPHEIEIVRLVLKLRQTGKTLWDIAHYLNNLGHKNRRGTAWEHSLVRNIINRHEGNLERIEEEIWESVNSRRQ